MPTFTTTTGGWGRTGDLALRQREAEAQRILGPRIQAMQGTQPTAPVRPVAGATTPVRPVAAATQPVRPLASPPATVSPPVAPPRAALVNPAAYQARRTRPTWMR